MVFCVFIGGWGGLGKKVSIYLFYLYKVLEPLYSKPYGNR